VTSTTLQRWVESGALRHHRSSRREIADLLAVVDRDLDDVRDLATYFDSCRILRNASDYDRAGVVASSDVKELLREAAAFRGQVLAWLRETHPRLV